MYRHAYCNSFHYLILFSEHFNTSMSVDHPSEFIAYPMKLVLSEQGNLTLSVKVSYSDNDPNLNSFQNQNTSNNVSLSDEEDIKGQNSVSNSLDSKKQYRGIGLTIAQYFRDLFFNPPRPPPSPPQPINDEIFSKSFTTVSITTINHVIFSP